MTTSTWQDIRFDYSGAHVLVTGGTSGIGAAIASAYREAGATVTVTGTRRSSEEYEEDLTGYRYLKLDVSDYKDIDAVIGAVPQLDILVNNGGTPLTLLGLDEYEPENFDRAIRMHVTGVYRLANGLKSHLTKSRLPGGGSLIGIVSLAAFFGAQHGLGYGAGKAAMVQLVKTLAISWAKHNIRVNAVAPGLTENRVLKTGESLPASLAEKVAEIPRGRIGEAKDIAGPVLFLTSSAAANITGQTVISDGGLAIAI